MLKTFIRLLIFGVCLSSISVSQPKWKLLPNSPSGDRFDDLYFINSKTGWAGAGKVYKTTDSGNNWFLLDSQIVRTRSIGFLDSTTGFVGSLDTAKILYRTTNGGLNWILIQNIPNPVPKGICGISITNGVVYACGRFTGPAVVIKSTDRGNTWTSINMSQYASTLIDCNFFSADSGFVTGGLDSLGIRKAVILFTSDGGSTWNQKAISSIDSTWGWKISFVNRLSGYVSIEKLSISGNSFFKTTDGGMNWTQLVSPIPMEGIGFVTEFVGWLGNAIMYKTTNGGLNWALDNFGINNPFINRIRFYGDTLGYAAGSRIFKYSNDTSIGIQNNQIHTPKDFVLHQNYPNPFNPSTVIKYEMFENSMTTIRIFDILGKEVYVFVNGYRMAGIYDFNWDGTDNDGNILPSGVYFYQLETEKNTETKKLVLVR